MTHIFKLENETIWELKQTSRNYEHQHARQMMQPHLLPHPCAANRLKISG